jgi:hypothetical protein
VTLTPTDEDYRRDLAGQEAADLGRLREEYRRALGEAQRLRGLIRAALLAAGKSGPFCACGERVAGGRGATRCVQCHRDYARQQYRRQHMKTEPRLP